MSKITNAGNPVWHGMLYSRIHMATVGLEWLRYIGRILTFSDL